MFTAEYRGKLRPDILDHAAGDRRLSGAAITGSVAAGREDPWSDIDLAFGVADAAQVGEVLSDFTVFLYERHNALHHHDVRAGAWTYRVFFLPGTLQVDLAFVAASEFRPLGPAFKLVFGEANPAQPFPRPAPIDIIGLAWLHALHARSCILREKLWQAEYMITGVRNHVMALACIRHGVPSEHGRGMDELPREVTAALSGSLIREFCAEELWRALGAAIQGLLAEIRLADTEFAAKVAADIGEICNKPVSAGTPAPHRAR
jgi:hypothetical protein